MTAAPVVSLPNRSAVYCLDSRATADQRRAALMELADLIAVEDGQARGDKPLSPVVDLIVPPLCSHLCPDPVKAFNALVAAKQEFSTFVADEADWATAHDFGTSAETLANLYERLLSDVEFAADALMGVRS